MYEIWRQRNSESRMYMDTKKLMNQKNYIMKHNKITEMETEEIKKEMQAYQRSHLEEKEEEELEHHHGYHKGSGTEAEHSSYNRRRNGDSSTKGSDLQIKRKN